MLHDTQGLREFVGDTRQPVESLQVRRLHTVGPLGAAAFLLYLATTIAYFVYRIPLWNPRAPIFSSLMLAAELFGTMTLLLHVFSTWTLVERRAAPPPDGYDADILITTWNEPLDILRNTILAAKQVRYARDIWLLDDGCRKEMEELAQELGVRYIARSDRSHAKAGNLNNALKFTKAAFVAIFDCDHAPSPDFLERTLGYFIDPSVAFVQTPQDFYNTGSFQHRGSAETKEAWHEQTLFYRVIQPGKDHWNAAFFCGSCAVMRKAALDEIGGIATGTITEDMHTSLRIHKHGWNSVYHSEALAFGLSPATLDQYDTQRLRWGRGAMQVWLKEGILFRGHLTFAQRMAYFMSTITYFEGWQKAVIYFLPMVVLLTGSMPIIWAGWPLIEIFLLWFISGVLVNELFSRGYAKTIWTEEYNFFRFYTFMKATLALVIPIKWRFSVTPKGMDVDTGSPLRLWPQFLVAIGAIASIVVGTSIYVRHHHLPEGAYVANIVWLVINSAIAIKALAFATGRREHKRTEHRFPLPLLARIRTGDGAETQTAIAFDVSSRGMSLKLPANHPFGSLIQGDLILPNGPTAFRASVQRQIVQAGSSDVMLGLSFNWRTAGESDALNSCLYGNTLQWDVNNWSEVRKFRVWELFRHGSGKYQAPSSDWQLGRLRSSAGKVHCMIRRERDAFRILTYEQISLVDDYALQFDGLWVTGLKMDGYRQYSVGGGKVSVATLGGAKAGPFSSHREPKWIEKAGANR